MKEKLGMTNFKEFIDRNTYEKKNEKNKLSEVQISAADFVMPQTGLQYTKATSETNRNRG